VSGVSEGNVTTNLIDRYRGVMLGLACGDALGAQVEFKARHSFPHQRDMTGGGPHRLQPGQWTDDTAMALLLAEHLLSGDPEVRKPALLAGRWVAWYRRGVGSCTGKCFDIGTQTASALQVWEDKGVPPRLRGTKARGNGALMRTAPAALAHATLSPVQGSAYRQAMVTHGQQSAELCATFAGLLFRAVRAEKPADFLYVLGAANRDIVQRSENEVRSTGYDVDTYEAAIWCVAHSYDAEEAIMRAANLGDDADTVAAVTGALAGALWGDTLPQRWLSKLAWRGDIVIAAENLYEMAHRA
jgi:ADP-ribosyl-[dinitrogen reductase] hydrolase